MNVWIDILHTPQFNFFKPLISTLSEKGYNMLITVLGRGKLPAIVKRELSGMKNVSVKVIGKHRMTKWSALIEANALRIIRLFFWAMRNKVDIAFSSGSHIGMMGKIFKFPAYGFVDDPQTTNYKMLCKFDKQNHSLIYELPEGQQLDPRDKMLPVLKEWAYLNPRTFRPNVRALEQYGLKPKKYIFLREVSVGTINYTGQESGAILGIKDMIPKGMKVLLSLEEKKRRGEYPEDWILLQEPIEDIHSLIYYAAGLVSSGDSMAREAALMGVPAYYLGIRYTMPANKAASNVAGLQNRKTMDFREWISNIIENKNINNTACAEINHKNSSSGNQKKINENVSSVDTRAEMLLKQQQELREHIDAEFIDINAYMMSLVESVDKK